MRKQPAQKRSREMVSVLLEATARTIVSRGLEHTTTNHIAEAAGVSVGSLYQYFDSKESIIEALLNQRMDGLLEVVDAQQQSLMDESPKTISRGILTVLFEVVEEDPCLRELTRNWDSLRNRSTFKKLEQHMIEACRMYILRHHDRYQITNLPAVLFVTINSLQYAVAHYMGLKRPSLKREDVIEALSDMLDAYLNSMAK